jgi:hypothetical protein
LVDVRTYEHAASLVMRPDTSVDEFRGRFCSRSSGGYAVPNGRESTYIFRTPLLGRSHAGNTQLPLSSTCPSKESRCSLI